MTLKERAKQRQQVLADFHESGLTQAAFCRARGIALSTLQYRLKREREEAAGKKQAGFVKLAKSKTTPATSGSPFRVRIGERVVVEVDPPVTEQQLANIFKAAGAL